MALAGTLVFAVTLLTAGYSAALGPPPCDPSDPGCGSSGGGSTTVQVKLTVAVPSSGTVQDSPQAGINCGTDCSQSYNYTLDCSSDPCGESDVQSVTLVASGGPTGDTPVFTVCDSNFTGTTCANSRGCGGTQCTVSMDRSLKVSVAWVDQSPPMQPTFSVHPAKLGPSGGTFTATSSDNIGVTRMLFFLDAGAAGDDSSPPYNKVVLTDTYADGSSHTVSAVAMDGAGNQSPPSNPVTFTVDKSTAVAIQAPPAGGSFKTPPQFSFSEPADFGSATCETLSGPSGNNVIGSASSCNGGTYTPQSGPDGVYRMKVTLTDNVGNTASDERSFQIDTVAPLLQVTNPASGTSATSPVTPAYIASDPGSGSPVTVTCRLDGDVTFGACATMDLPLGPHALTVRAEDLAGNQTDVTVPFSVVRTPVSRKVSISFKHGSFKGSVRPGGGCASGEAVRLYEVKPGPDRVVGHARTKPNGRWSIRAPNGSGLFYVKIKPSSDGDESCLKTRSKTIKLT